MLSVSSGSVKASRELPDHAISLEGLQCTLPVAQNLVLSRLSPREHIALTATRAGGCAIRSIAGASRCCCRLVTTTGSNRWECDGDHSGPHSTARLLGSLPCHIVVLSPLATCFFPGSCGPSKKTKLWRAMPCVLSNEIYNCWRTVCVST